MGVGDFKRGYNTRFWIETEVRQERVAHVKQNAERFCKVQCPPRLGLGLCFAHFRRCDRFPFDCSPRASRV